MPESVILWSDGAQGQCSSSMCHHQTGTSAGQHAPAFQQGSCRVEQLPLYDSPVELGIVHIQGRKRASLAIP